MGKPAFENIREIVIHKNASLYYEVDEVNQKIILLLFKDNRENPESYQKLLNS